MTADKRTGSTFSDLMIDTETLSMRTRALPLAIAAVRFDRYARTGKEVGAEENVGTAEEHLWIIERESAEALGLDVEEKTVAWWEAQPEAYRALLESAEHVPIEEALRGLAEVVRPQTDHLWARGVNYDLGMVLRPAYRAAGIGFPWDFRRIRCVRSLEVPKEQVSGRHDPTSDALAQIRAVQKYYARRARMEELAEKGRVLERFLARRGEGEDGSFEEGEGGQSEGGQGEWVNPLAEEARTLFGRFFGEEGKAKAENRDSHFSR